MRITWKQRLIQQPAYRDIATWPFIDVQTLPRAKHALFLRNRRIAAQALAGETQAAIAASHGIDRSLISYLMDRCMGGDEDTDPALTAGLVPRAQLRNHGRRAALSTLQTPTGARGAFQALLTQLPSVKDGLDRMIRAGVQRRAEGQNLLPKALHAEFKRLLREAQWPTDRYPYTEKSQAYESLRQYWHRCSNELRMPTGAITRVIRPITTAVHAYDEIQIDEQMFDVQGRIDVELNGIHEPLRVGRISLACMIDKATDCRLGFHVCLTTHPSQFDLLSLLYSLHAPWQPMTLTTPGLAYAPGACFPSALGFPFSHAGIGILRLDNAFSHAAHLVRDYVCDRMGGTLSLGLVAHPKARHDIEHAFDLVSDHARRFASTTGSHPHDPLREARKHRDKPPRVTLRTLEEALSVILTQHNITPQARLGGRSPLDLLQHHARDGWLRLLPDHVVHNLNPFVQRQAVTVHWLKHEKRRPYINFQYVRYTGDSLCNPALANTSVVIEYDTRDIRALKAYSEQGVYLGELRAPLSWQQYAHGITTRRYVHKLSKTERLNLRDPLGGYFAYLLERRRLPKTGLEMLRVYREFHGDSVSFVPPDIEPVPILQSVVDELAPRRIPDWHPSLFTMSGVQHARPSN